MARVFISSDRTEVFKGSISFPGARLFLARGKLQTAINGISQPSGKPNGQCGGGVFAAVSKLNFRLMWRRTVLDRHTTDLRGSLTL